MTKYYTKDHEWIDEEGVMGISSYAVKQLGDITFIELPIPGTTFEQGEMLCEVESVKAASDIYIPVSSTVEEVNEKLEANPGDISSDPEGNGWIAKLTLSSHSELSSLMNESEYEEYLSQLD